MSAKIRMRRRVTSGNIKDPELHRERLTDIQMRRQVVWAITLVVACGITFVAVSLAMHFAG